MSNEDTINKISDYMKAEMEASLRDYELLDKMNKKTVECFKDYMVVAEKIAKNVDRINENQKARARLDKLNETIDDLDNKVNSLEALAYRIDSYSKRLEESFKRLNSST